MSEKRIICLLITIMALMSASGALGQQQKGDSQLQIQGSLNLDLSGDSEDSGIAVLSWGRFFTDNQEAGISLSAVIVSDGDFAGFGGPFWRYNFGNGKTVPFIGASAAASFGDFSTGSDFLLTFEGGVRWFLERNIALSLSGTTTYDIDNSDFNDQLQVLFGFSYFWQK